jgi:outer membrane protein assembly factor BamE (lipoprotein component of BamABCDE complex)
MNTRYNVKRWAHLLTVAALLAAGGCTTSGQVISEQSMEERIATLRIGQTKSEVESALGLEHSTDRNRWAYNFSDSVFEIAERRQGPGLGILPISAGVFPTNTRAVVTLAFNDRGVVQRLEVARFFSDPFINDYWYVVKAAAKEPLESIAKLGEAAGMKVVGLEKDVATFTLEDNGTKAKIAVKLDGQTLRITSRNPYDRLASEYRAFAKREYALMNSIGNSEIVQ